MQSKVRLGALLSGIHFMVGRMINKAFSDEGEGTLSVSRYRIMRALWEEEGITAQKVCDKTALAKSTLSIMTSHMEADGLITREAGEHDRREVLLKLTDKGKRLSEEYLNKAENAIDVLYDGMSEEEISRFESSVMKIYENLAIAKDPKKKVSVEKSGDHTEMGQHLA